MAFHRGAPRAGSEAERRALLHCFALAPFSEHSVCECLRIPELDALEGTGRAALAARFDDRDLRGVIVRIFVLGSAVTAHDFAEVVDAHAAAAMRTLDLIATLDADGDVYSPIRLVPLSDGSGSDRTLFVASDRGDTPDGSQFEPFPEIVFSGHNPLTRQFLRLLPTSRTGAALDLCSGTAIGAMVAEAHADRVTAVDITGRCTEFARFNCWLNGSERVDVRQGDLYDAVRGERFDRILAHPPYVPALSETLIYRDGGETGDRLLRSIVEGLPAHLSPAGTFHALSIGMDVGDKPFETRVREWLGPAAGEFDIVFAFGSSMPPDEFARSLVTRAAGARPDDYDRWIDLFTRRQIKEVVYGALAARRFAGGGEAQTRRVVAGPATGPAGFEFLFRWFDWLRQPDRLERVLSARLTLSAGARVDVQHVAENGGFVPRRFRLSNGAAPFNVQLDTDGWVVVLLNALDGTRTAGEVRDALERAGQIPCGMSEVEFVDLVCLLIERGFLLLTADRFA